MNFDPTLVWNIVLKKHLLCLQGRGDLEEWGLNRGTRNLGQNLRRSPNYLCDSRQGTWPLRVLLFQMHILVCWSLRTLSPSRTCVWGGSQWENGGQHRAVKLGGQNLPVFIMKLLETKSKFLPILHTSIPSRVTPRTTALPAPPELPDYQSHVKSHHLTAIYLGLGSQTCCVCDSLTNTRIVGDMERYYVSFSVKMTRNKSDVTNPPNQYMAVSGDVQTSAQPSSSQNGFPWPCVRPVILLHTTPFCVLYKTY